MEAFAAAEARHRNREMARQIRCTRAAMWTKNISSVLRELEED